MKKFFWMLMMAGSILGWLFVILGIAKPFDDDNLKKVWKGMFCAWVFGHPLELILSIRIGKAAGISTLRSVVKTLAFGFTWWLPLKLGIIKK